MESDTDIGKIVFATCAGLAGAALFYKAGKKTYEALSDAPNSDVAKMVLEVLQK
ncbi:hypothetical protein [Treponema saccharophilum]|uniref:hypothetical protein n=1 Tax=Treponema saccharophilum TaxID=165 RepID=UPI00131F435D|nr:hypothetical protein [Treponema saccharophilum]